MKKDFLIIFGLATIILGIIILFISSPKYIIYEGEVIGKILDENNSPISGAKVTRIEEKISSHPKYGYQIVTLKKSEVSYSNQNGEFYLKKKGKIFFTWLLAYSKSCSLNFEIEKIGYKKYKSSENEWLIKNESSLCNQTTFRPIVILKKD